MSRRRLYLDDAPGERRGVVTLGGRPERLFLERLDDADGPWLGRMYLARVARIERSLSAAFLDLGAGEEAMLALTGDARALVEGAAVEIQISAEARSGKLAQARFVGPGAGAPRALSSRPDLAERLQSFASGAVLTGGREAREAADEAEAQVLATEHALPGGGSLAIEPTRALVAIDVDLGARLGDARRIARQANHTAIDEAARLLRLKGLAGLIVIDLVGAGHDGPGLAAQAKQAFAPDEPGVALGPTSRFGAMQLVTPWRVRPRRELLCDRAGCLSARTLALRLMRALEREGEADRGARLLARCAPPVAEAAQDLAGVLAERIGPRFEIMADPALGPEQLEVKPR